MKSNKGFSLVELIVVIAIMAIIAGVAIPVYTHYIDDAEAKVDASIQGEVEHAFAIECALVGLETPTVAVSGGSVTVTFTGDADDVADVVGSTKAIIGDYFTDAYLTADATGLIYTGTIAE